MMKKGLSILLVVLIMISITLSACQGKKTDTEQQGAANDGKPLERVSLRVFIPGSATPVPSDIDPQNNKWADIYKKAFPEVDFEFLIFPSASAAEKKTLMMYSGDFPDMVPASQMEIINWSQQGIIVPLDDVVKKYYPNINKFVNAEDMKITMYEGKQWAMPVPANRLQNPDGAYIRKDWLEKLNLKMPTTLDEAYEVMKAFVTKDPDGNGKNDTFGISGIKNLDRMWSMYSPFDVQPGWYTRVNGKLIPDNIRPEMREALTFLRKLYAEGLLDKDTLVQSAAQLNEKVTAGKVGIYGNNTWNLSGTANPMLKNTINGEYATMPPLKGPKGVQQIHSQRDTGNLFTVTINCKKPEYPAKLLNWLLEQDKTKSYYSLNTDLINCGEVGVNATVTGKYISNLADSQLSEEGKKENYRYAYRLMYGSMNIFTEADQIAHAEELVKAGVMTQNWVEDKKITAKYGKPNARIITGPIAAEKESELNTYFNEIKVKIVSGAEPIESFDKWIEYFNKNGGDKIIEEANRLNPAK